MRDKWLRTWDGMSFSAVILVSGVAISIASPREVYAQTTMALPSLVLDDVTIVDVEQGRLLPEQRVVITGNRIQSAGPMTVIPWPHGARVIKARGKYLIPGLWDMHVHSPYMAHWFYPLFIANGVTGVRDAGSELPLRTLRRWRDEILAGTRVGPPRQILSGPALNDELYCVFLSSLCPRDLADARAIVDSLKVAGADMIKHRALSPPMYAAIVAEARRVGLPSGGHMPTGEWTVMGLADSGVRILDHLTQFGDFGARCWQAGATLTQCQPVAEHFQRKNTWWVPTLIRYFQDSDFRVQRAKLPNGLASEALLTRFDRVINHFWAGTLPSNNWLGGIPQVADPNAPRLLSLIQRTHLPILTGTDVDIGPGSNSTLWAMPPGFSLHMELALYVAEGLTSLEALRAATLNPAKMWHATDSLGTVASGKLADLVLLDADPLADITNTTVIRAVIANGRYFSRNELDQLLADARNTAEGAP